MKTLHPFLIVTALFSCLAPALRAQNIAPELAGLKAKYELDLAEIEKAKTAALAKEQQPYAAALKRVEKTVTGVGDLETGAIVTKERVAVEKGVVDLAFPKGLPASLQGARKKYLEGAELVFDEEKRRLRTLDSAYLRDLGRLAAKAPANSELARQIDAEKQRLVKTVAPGQPASGEAPKRSARNAVVNGNFDAGGAPLGWNLSLEEGVTFNVVTEGLNRVLRVTVAGKPRQLFMEQDIEVSPSAKTFSLKAHIRGKATDHDASDDNSGANVNARFIGADGKLSDPDTILVGGKDEAWKTLSKDGTVLDGAKSMRVFVGVQMVAGTFDFDDVEVEFR